jgi:hypothetical protein
MRFVSTRARLGLVAVAIVGGLFVASAALAQDRSEKAPAQSPDAGSSERGPQGRAGRGMRERVARNTMRVSREIYYDGRTIVVKTDRGELVSVGDSSLNVKYLDGSTAQIRTVGEVKVCASGNPEAGLKDLKAGKPVAIHTATNLPGGDLTVVVQSERPDELKTCKGLLKSAREKLKMPEVP